MQDKSDSKVPEQLLLKDHLHNFGEAVIDICDREEQYQLSAQAAYQKIRQMWLQLQKNQPEIKNYIHNN
ncbi:hypothetical protein Sta7437_0823 [Stanieria cyanosphaera PCC 7437]|uniref:Uncharacterized protein n=1 Tax=Stanieria cyanosphaera (strain ATCC 29371 / PCC 7437) TaxID=111780 RepID=K9XQS6_STAC7|nr:hypothetical protein [Stanieria cyanosphaera]AFZ34411.1 hypothetical protein Sta7437_0823 [Stanieria cyanosphaera PCC 7437]